MRASLSYFWIYLFDGFANDCRDDNIDYLLIRALACSIVFYSFVIISKALIITNIWFGIWGKMAGVCMARIRTTIHDFTFINELGYCERQCRRQMNR